jgi:hypothetical protein
VAWLAVQTDSGPLTSDAALRLCALWEDLAMDAGAPDLHMRAMVAAEELLALADGPAWPARRGGQGADVHATACAIIASVTLRQFAPDHTALNRQRQATHTWLAQAWTQHGAQGFPAVLDRTGDPVGQATDDAAAGMIALFTAKDGPEIPEVVRLYERAAAFDQRSAGDRWWFGTLTAFQADGAAWKRLSQGTSLQERIDACAAAGDLGGLIGAGMGLQTVHRFSDLNRPGRNSFQFTPAPAEAVQPRLPVAEPEPTY